MKNKQEYILCAAIWYKDGKKHEHQPKNVDTGYVFCGRRHHNAITLHYQLTGIKTYEEKSVQGFVTSKDRFVDRQEAAKIALDCGQIVDDSIEVTDTLISEDLY